MKKMILAFTIIMVAFVAQAAATLNWNTWTYDANESGLAEGRAYLVLVTATDPTTFSLSSSLVLTGGDIVDSCGYNALGEVEGSWQEAGENLTPGTTYLFAIITTTAGTMEDVLPTSGLYALDDNGGNFYSVDWDGAGGGVASVTTTDDVIIKTDKAVTVPEPTVLALLALGVAGLALRRRA